MAIELEAAVIGAIVAAVLGAVTVVVVTRYVRSPEAREAAAVRKFKKARTVLKTQRDRLAREAWAKAKKEIPEYCEDSFDAMPLLRRNGALAASPVPLNQAIKPEITDGEQPDYAPQVEKTKYLWPHEEDASYSDAIESYDKPMTFEDRPSYRLDNLASVESPPIFRVGRATYFQYQNTGEVLAFEKASGENRYRKSINNPFDFSGRAAVMGINTLTLVRTPDGLKFLLVDRDTKGTASAMGTRHVVPAGEFQQANLRLGAFSEDCDLWRNIMREYAEELLGEPEPGPQTTYEYEYERRPYKQLTAALKEGKIKAYYLGTGLDPLTLKPEVLTVCVFKETTFWEIFPEDELQVTGGVEGNLVVFRNKENNGQVVLYDFDDATIQEMLTNPDRPLLPAGRAALQIAFKHREDFI